MFGQTKKMVDDKENIPLNDSTEMLSFHSDEKEDTVSLFKPIKVQKRKPNAWYALYDYACL